MEIIKDNQCNIIFRLDGCNDAPGHWDKENNLLSFKMKLSKDDLDKLIDSEGHIFYQLFCQSPIVVPFRITTEPIGPWQK